MTTPDSLNFKYTLTEDDVVRANWARSERVVKWLRWGLVPVVLLAAIYAIEANWTGLLELLALIAVFGGLRLLMTWQIRSLARKSPHFGIDYEMTASPDGLASVSAVGDVRFRWSAYISVRETAEYFLLYSGVGQYFPLPKRIFTDPRDLNRFRDLVRAHVPKARLLDRPEK